MPPSSRRYTKTPTKPNVRNASAAAPQTSSQISISPPDPAQLYLGIALVALSAFIFVFGLYAVVFSSYMPYSGIFFLDALKDDEHYKYLVPLLVPAGLAAIIINWGGLKFFRHQ